VRARRSILVALVFALWLVAVPTIGYAGDGVVVAQGTTDDSETQGGETGGSDTSDAEGETTSEEGESAEAVTETGPPWTYQMGRMALALTALLGLAIIRMYYKLVVSRQKGAA
jgi:hypothetical protein